MSSLRLFTRACLGTALPALLACASQHPNVAAERADACERPVSIAQGAVAGEEAAEGICTWKGIPFGNSGREYRFRRPGPPPAIDGVLAADTFGPACLAPVLGFLAPGGVAEDCLNLNIWSPLAEARAPDAGRPVMVFIYGGAFILGSGSWMVYDGTSLAGQGVVLVTINYRLGPLGFYGSAAQQAGNPDKTAGNWGIWDQIAALEWVRDNIAAFGGNPANVTIFGESAGGFSVCTLLASPAAKGLFHRAIMESGGCLVHTLEEQFEAARALVARTDCAAVPDTAACLRSLDADDVNLYQWMWRGSAPTVDGVLLEEQPIETLRAGRGNAVPLLVGANREELRPLTLLPNIAWNLSTSPQRYWGRVADASGEESAQTLQALYRPEPGAGVRELWSDMATDIFFRCSVLWAAEAQAQSAPVYAYEFDVAERETWGGKQMGAYHAVELPYVFGFLGWPRVMSPGVGIEARSAAYSRTIQNYWTRFAATGDPNSADADPWPPYQPRRTIARLHPAGTVAMEGYRQKRCDYWASKGYATFPEQVRFFVDFSGGAGVPLDLMFGMD